ncbi:MAG: hypothetical protein M3373_13485, partial [Gemmatimonadota bacterium]|nr:hypothetical protein [Gemmatimonadota bacterium]
DAELCERLYARALREGGIEPAPELLAYLTARGANDVREILVTVDRLMNAVAIAGRAPTVALARKELEGLCEITTGSSPAVGSLAASGGDPFFLDREKTVWDWPDIGGRAIEELR